VSTPPEPGQPVRRRAIEPTYVQRRRRTEALAELLREVREEQRNGAEPDEDYELVPVPATGTKAVPPPPEDETEELPPVLGGEDYARSGGSEAAWHPARALGLRQKPESAHGHVRSHGHGRGAGVRRTAIAIGVTAAALVGFALALLLPGGSDSRAQAGTGAPTTPAAQAPARTGDPDGAGTLREGDSGPDVTDLQQRLLRIPNVYDSGATSGSYDATLTAAVARFQLWYGIRGDETGVYGNDTRAALESRTTL
jgi:hypothetical protein